MLAISKLGGRIFRNNVGTGWTGLIQRHTDGSIRIHDPRPIHAGLCKGSSDLIGWQKVTITPDMVGKNVAIFLAVEVKAEKGRASEDQLKFIERVNQDGGIGIIARSVADYESAIEKFSNQ